MKIIKLLANPIVIALIFCLLLISGKAIGGIYLMYLLFGLSAGAIHSFLGLAAILFLCFSIPVSKTGNGILLKIFLQVGGIASAILSIVLFFYLDRTGYNLETFDQTVPVATFYLWSVCLFSFVVRSVADLKKYHTNLKRAQNTRQNTIG